MNAYKEGLMELFSEVDRMTYVNTDLNRHNILYVELFYIATDKFKLYRKTNEILF